MDTRQVNYNLHLLFLKLVIYSGCSAHTKHTIVHFIKIRLSHIPKNYNLKNNNK